jgi:hypothetical protein
LRFSAFCRGAASALGQITDDTQAPPDQPVHVRVHAGDLQKEAIPPTIFGSFLEPIGHSTYGGLWSELLENGSFYVAAYFQPSLRDWSSVQIQPRTSVLG